MLKLREISSTARILLCASALAGCATHAIDESKLASASAAASLAADQCFARPGAQSVSEAMACFLAARRQFFVSVKFKEMDVFEAYASRVMLAAGQTDRREITVAQYTDRLKDMGEELSRNVLISYRAQEDQNARTAAALHGLAVGLSAAGASMRGPESIHCTSVQTGVFTNTDCQ